ncbi:ABC transporter ATP-binding protein [Maritimibacter alkaliphilus]|uniref:ABC transporter ATP-binding protein n=1 Tax=Maritimibacter alkaliphilus TaxID=404236 RepID=UPI001C97BA0F|nr:ABC transporter ATP-binding protein [Maritimibacter alkaliphilus]MBY6090473.1 ABC transporter ATP-binding protein [Maritimibacter alkaliphilus]
MAPHATAARAPAGEVQGASLSLHGLCKDYGTANAVRGIDLDLAPGRFLTLLGPSGSGKTTTLMMIAGFIDPSAGEIRINGRDVTELPAHKRDIGMVFQNYALFPHLTVQDNVGFALTMRGINKRQMQAQAQEFLTLVGLAGFEKRYPHQLSGGQQQRVALARALVFSPSLVLMDEPLGALDRRLRLQMQEEIKRIHDELGLTVVYVTHDQEEALTMSDDIAVMEDGVIASFASPRDTYEAPGNRFTAKFIGESNFLIGFCEDWQAGVASVRLGEQLLRVAAPQPLARGQEVTVFVRPERLRLTDSTAEMANALPCELISEIYLGESCIYTVRLSDGTHLKVRRPNRGVGVTPDLIPDLVVGFEPENGRILTS